MTITKRVFLSFKKASKLTKAFFVISAQEPCIKALGALGVPEILIFLKRNNLRLTPSEKVIDPQIGFKKKMVEKFLKNPKEANFGKELKAANVLLKNYSEEFWEKFSLPFKLNSLFFFLSQNGKEILYKANIEKKEVPTFKQEKQELSSV